MRIARHLGALLLAGVVGCGGGGGSGSRPGTGGGPTPTPTPHGVLPGADTLGFVLTSFGFDYPDSAPGACPQGWNLSPREQQVQTGVLPPDDCEAPEANVDPDFLVLDVPGVMRGFDLDGVASSLAAPGSGECAHDDFTGPGGEPGIDYQLWRAIGCIRGFQDGGIVQNVQDDAVIDGSMTILVQVSGVDDRRNDDEVEVRIFGSTDLPPLGSDGEVLPWGTLDVHADPHYHGTVGRGRIVDGRLEAGPMDVQLRLNIQIVDADLPLDDAFVRIDLAPDGTASGQLAGYWSVDAAYEVFGRQGGAAAADALAYTCTGLHAALVSHADGDFDPATGTCRSLSTIYRFTAQPAFVVE